MPKRKYQKPLAIDLEFNEALERFALTDPAEVRQEVAADAEAQQRVRLVQRQEGGHPLLIYSTERGAHVGLPFKEGTFWATQQEMADVFGVTRQNVTMHLKHIYADGELDEASTSKDSLRVGKTGQEYTPKEYNLNAIISVGYRVGGKPGTLFRMWATDRLVQILTKGFYIDVERLKAPDAQDRVAEVRAILQDIRSEQANVHRELERICAQCQDYSPTSKVWRQFFQNTSAAIFFAAAQATPSEIIRERANADADNMGLWTWPKAEIRKADVTVGKNYLRQPEIDDLNRFSSLLLDFMIDHAAAGRLVTMAQASERIAEVTEFTGRRVLKDGGSVLRKDADEWAHAQYAIFDGRRKEARRIAMDKAYDDASDARPKKLEGKG
jgi:hypothetical protein